MTLNIEPITFPVLRVGDRLSVRCIERQLVTLGHDLRTGETQAHLPQGHDLYYELLKAGTGL